MRDKYQWGRGFSDYTILLTSGSRAAKADPTLASGDVTISKDGGAFANLATLPTVSPAGGVQVKVTLSDAECQAKSVMIRFKDAAGGEWEEQTLVLSSMDARENMVQYHPYGSDHLVERIGGGTVSGSITRTGYPSMGVLYTDLDLGAPLKTDLDTRLLCGALIYNEEVGTAFEILGGYFFDDSSDSTQNVFGICKDYDLFEITEGGSNIVNSLWTGAGAEASHGDGWTFVVAPTAQSWPTSEDELFLYIRPSAVAESAFSRTIDVSRISAINPNGDGMLIEGGENGLYCKATDAVNGVGVRAEGAPGASGADALAEEWSTSGGTATLTKQNDILSILGTPVGASMSADILAVDVVVDAMQALLTLVDGKVDVVDTVVDAIAARLPASGSISNFSPSTQTVDGMTYDYAYELIAALVNGRYALNTPDTGKITFYKRDNITPLTVVEVNTSVRTRIS